MINGIVTKHWDPVVSIKLIGPQNESRDIEAIVDTGFNGHLCLPETIIEDLDMQWCKVGSVILADGSTSLYDCFEGQLIWHGVKRRVPVDMADSIPLIGMQLLEDSELRIRAVVGGDVRIRPLTDPLN